MSLYREAELVCEPCNGQEAIDCLKRFRPDVMVMDIRMPVLDGLATTKLIRKLGFDTPVLLIS